MAALNWRTISALPGCEDVPERAFPKLCSRQSARARWDVPFHSRFNVDQPAHDLVVCGGLCRPGAWDWKRRLCGGGFTRAGCFLWVWVMVGALEWWCILAARAIRLSGTVVGESNLRYTHPD